MDFDARAARAGGHATLGRGLIDRQINASEVAVLTTEAANDAAATIKKLCDGMGSG
jgi:hypothetical protein